METGHLHHALMRTLGAAFACAVVVGSAAAQQVPALTTAEVEAFADSFLARYLGEDLELSLALVVVSGDSIVLSKGYGSENAQRPVDPSSTVFNVASLSNLFVATAAMQLVERGMVTLDGDIEPLLGRRIIGAGPPITLRHLLTHTSGLEGPFLREVVAGPRQVMPLGDYFSAYPPRRSGPLSAAARYSNYGTALAGHLIERVSGETFHDYVERNVFRPLNMTGSSFRQPPPLTLMDRTATVGTGPVPNALLTYPSGPMVSTPADMSRFMLAHLNGGRLGESRILSDASVRLMHAAQWRADPRVPGVGLGFFESTIGGEPGLFHTGARGHFSLLYLFPERRVGVFLVHATRRGGAFQSLRSEFIRALAARYFPQRWRPLRRASDDRARELVSMIALVMTHKGDDAAAEGLRRALWVGCTLLLAAMALAVSLLPLGVLAWRRGYWRTPRRVLYYALASGAVVAAPLLAHYHLLGHWF